MKQSVFFFGGAVTVGRSFQIVFDCANGVQIWNRTEPTCLLCLCQGASGSGKSTFLRCLYNHIHGRNLPAESGVTFSFEPAVERNQMSIALIPQDVTIVRHWRLSELFPIESPFFNVLFSDRNGIDFRKAVLADFSGGQQMKIYVCSVLEKMISEKRQANFLILDETLDGLGVTDANHVLSRIAKQWNDRTSGESLHILAVSHLPSGEGKLGGTGCSPLRLSVTENAQSMLKVAVSNE